MATILIDNFSLYGDKPNFDRDRVANTAEMLNFNVTTMKYYYGQIVFCLENGKHYKFVYNYNNPPADNSGKDAVTGWFKEFATGDGGTITESAIAEMGFTKNKGTVTGVSVNGNPVTQPDKNGVITLQLNSGGGTIDTSSFATKEELAGKMDKVTLATVATSGKYDDLIDKPTFNTINGKNILGSGDIEINVSPAYPLVNHGTSDTTFTLTPNTFHVWNVVASLSLTFDKDKEVADTTNEYLFQFSTSSSTPTALSLPSNVRWAGGEVPQIEVMKTYQVSILNNCATMLSFG